MLFPELFTAQLFSTFDPTLDDRDAILQLADLEQEYKQLLQAEAKNNQIYIIGGSHPIRRDGKLFNVAHLFTPSGNIYTQDKLHITPGERRLWNIEAGEKIKYFDTPFARIAIVVCYDIEFPELARILTLKGVEVIFVPFSTDEKKAFNRVSKCAAARAIENYIYVVISGNVGNLHNVKSYLLNYGQASILTPSDFAFPPNNTEGQADPNIETVVVAELDLTILHMQREMGSVRPLYDRRIDLYDLSEKISVEKVIVE